MKMDLFFVFLCKKHADLEKNRRIRCLFQTCYIEIIDHPPGQWSDVSPWMISLVDYSYIKF